MPTLAQVIQAESNGTAADMFGVASVIQNRAASNFNGYGTTAAAQAFAPSQFSAAFDGSAARAVPSSTAQQYANAAENGTLSQYGNTGNATFYNAAGYAYQNNGSNSYPANSTGFPANVYSDQYNQQPSGGFQLPTLDQNSAAASTTSPASTFAPANPYSGTLFGNTSAAGAAGSGGGGAATNSGTIAGGDSSLGTLSGVDGPDPFTSSDGAMSPDNPFAGSAFGGASTANTGQGVLGATGGYGGSMTGALTSSGASVGLALAPVTGNATTGSIPGVTTASPVNIPATPAGSTTATGAGQPVNITDITSAGSKAANTLSTALGGLGKAVTGSEAAGAAAGTSWIGDFNTFGTDLLTRGGLVLVGVILLIGAFMFFYLENNKGSMPLVLAV